jgi:hypothetical protein
MTPKSGRERASRNKRPDYHREQARERQRRHRQRQKLAAAAGYWQAKAAEVTVPVSPVSKQALRTCLAELAAVWAGRLR